MTAPVTTILTPPRRRILAAIRDFHTWHGYAPTVRELADLVGMAPSSVQYQLGELRQAGWIRRAPNRSRALVVLDPATGRP
ncbi:LexA family protein [Actinoplanes sp. NPDC051513]|uniref:LexA family protein n=1 Tax=Actinoplanes sp. NPDC051513 TaxID=3363908 RepID=UPI00379EC307